MNEILILQIASAASLFFCAVAVKLTIHGLARRSEARVPVELPPSSRPGPERRSARGPHEVQRLHRRSRR